MLRLRYLATLLMILLPSLAFGADYTVCAAACDYTTIQDCDDAAVRGDSCTVSAGTYAERVLVTTAASGTDTITFTAIGTVNMLGFLIQADYIIVDGFAINNTADCDAYANWLELRRDCSGVQIEGDYVQVLNNTITGAPYHGVTTLGSSYTAAPHYATITGNTITNVGFVGIITGGTNHLINNNDISAVVQWHGDTLDADDSDGIRFYGTDQIFRGNFIHDIPQTGGNATSHIDCFQTGQGTATTILFERNICYNECATLGQGALVTAGAGITVSDITFQYNVFRMTGEDRCCLNTDRTLGVGTVANIAFNNNVCATLVTESQLGVNIDQVAGAEVKNNIFYNFGDATYNYVYDQQENTGLDIGYNLIYKGNAVEPAAPGAYSNDVWMDDPVFSNFSASNFHLQSTSPAINVGTDLSLTTDCDNNSVPVGSAPDIGAYEYNPTNMSGSTIIGGSED